ncbi:MAG: MMPL family transporter [Streptosporangiales bacterium]|nr:MMPL family transporter [Streptosporangiales bacterium]
MFKLARLSLANRAIVALASLAIIAFGVFATFATKQELIPSLAMPSATVTAAYPGASPQIVEREVTEKVEAAISGVDGLESRTSTSSNGVAMVQAEFTYGTDIEDATRDLTEAVDRIQNDLPEDVDPQVQSGNTDDFPVVLLAASSDAGERALAQRLDDIAVPELRGIDGVRDVQVTGARDERLLVTLDQDELRKKGLTADAVSQALQANGVSIPGGELTDDGTTRSVEIGRSFDTLGELRDLEIMPASAPPRAEPGRQQTRPTPVPLSDVATVAEQLEPTSTITRTDGDRTLGLMVTKTSDANTVDVANAVKDELADLEDRLGDGAKLTVVFDQAPFIEDSIEGLATEGGIGLLFAVLIILLFLLSFRSTIVTALSIPFSLLVAVGGLYAGGYSFNILTLGALTVAVGRVVDDSIVVLENIKRHLGYGEEKRRAILDGVREVAGAVTASTLTTVGVFLPIAIVGGQVGELFRPFGVTVTIALLASLLVSLTIVPVLAYWFLRSSTAAPEEQARIEAAAVEKERRNPLQRAYVPVITWVTKHRVTTIAAGLVVFAATVAAVPLLQTNFLGSMGQNFYQVTQTMPVGTSLAETDEAAKRVEGVLSDLDDVESYQATVGGAGDFGGFGGGGATNEATFSVTTGEETDQEAFKDDLRERLDDLDGVGDVQLSDAAGPEGGSSGIEVVVHAPDDDALRTATERVENAVRDTPDTTEVTSNLAADLPTVQVDVDRTEAAERGLSEAQIGQAIRDAFEGKEAGSVVIGGEARDVLLRDTKAPGSVSAIRDFEVTSPAGGDVRVGDVATVREIERPAEITRTDGERTATVTATPVADDTGAVSTAVQERLDDVDLPEGASWDLGGVSQDQDEAFQQMLLALAAAILIVFMVMVATFRSIVQPFILLVSIPFAATGAIGLLLATDTALGVPGLIGLLMLVGIVVTNAIVLIDLINQYRHQGMTVRDAVVEGARRRLRPILMTALATIFALLPMAFGLTGGGVFISQPLAIVVIGGLVSSTLLTLVLVPTLYTMVEGAKERRQRRRAERGRHGDGRKAATRGDEADLSMADLTAPRPDDDPVPAPQVVVANGRAETEPGETRHEATVPVPTSRDDDGDGTVSVGVLQVEVLVRTTNSTRH